MANQIALMEYLQRGPPAIPTNPPPHPGPNTTNHAYGWEDIRSVNHWDTFNFQTVVQRYGQLLATTVIQDDPMPTSPPQAVNTENLITFRVVAYLKDRVKRALRSGFAHGGNALNGLTLLSFNGGDAARTIDQYRPDTAYFDPAIPVGTGWNRAPGDLKPSWKWSTNLRTSGNDRNRIEYFQVLSQVSFYMKQHHARYGYVLTDRELVVMRKRNEQGDLEVSTPIPWAAEGTAANPRMTVLLGLWYLGMLAAHDQGPDRWMI